MKIAGVSVGHARVTLAELEKAEKDLSLEFFFLRPKETLLWLQKQRDQMNQFIRDICTREYSLAQMEELNLISDFTSDEGRSTWRLSIDPPSVNPLQPNSYVQLLLLIMILRMQLSLFFGVWIARKPILTLPMNSIYICSSHDLLM